MVESEEELKSLLVQVKEENEKAGLKHNIKKTKIMASGPVISWQTDLRQQWQYGDSGLILDTYVCHFMLETVRTLPISEVTSVNTR